jgi:nitroimidazol reductase NimA-like FMN-containing flavoprotein (pyridoxamine 5'-phosphate oxidase superfamily)
MISKLSLEESYTLLRGSRVARLGCFDGAGPYVVPVNYVFDGESVYVHSLPGRKIEAMRERPRVCVQVDEIRGDFDWRSVIAFGLYEELNEPAERARALGLLLSTFPRLTPVEALLARDAAPPALVVFRIHVERVSGVREG